MFWLWKLLSHYLYSAFFYHSKGRCVPLNYKPCHGFAVKSMQSKNIYYYDINSTTFGTATQNVRRINFSSIAYFSLSAK